MSYCCAVLQLECGVGLELGWLSLTGAAGSEQGVAHAPARGRQTIGQQRAGDATASGWGGPIRARWRLFQAPPGNTTKTHFPGPLCSIHRPLQGSTGLHRARQAATGRGPGIDWRLGQRQVPDAESQSLDPRPLDARRLGGSVCGHGGRSISRASEMLRAGSTLRPWSGPSTCKRGHHEPSLPAEN